MRDFKNQWSAIIHLGTAAWQFWDGLVLERVWPRAAAFLIYPWSLTTLTRLVGANGLDIPYQGVVELNISLMGCKIEKAVFFVLRKSTATSTCIIGMNILRQCQDVLFKNPNSPISSLSHSQGQCRHGNDSWKQWKQIFPSLMTEPEMTLITSYTLLTPTHCDSWKYRSYNPWEAL